MIYDYTITTGKGGTLNLADYKGKVIMVVNTATGCGKSIRRWFTFPSPVMKRAAAAVWRQGADSSISTATAVRNLVRFRPIRTSMFGILLFGKL